MSLTRVGPKHQVTIPSDVFRRLALEAGDYLDVRIEKGSILMIPAKVVPKDQAWFHTPEWQAKEREADEAIARGEVAGPFSTARDLVRHLRNAQAAAVRESPKRPARRVRRNK